MTAHPRSLLVCVVALLLPACLHTDASPYNGSPPDSTNKATIAQGSDSLHNTQFAELISRPGVVIPLKPPKESASSDPVEPPTKDDGSNVIKPLGGPGATTPPPAPPSQIPESPLLSALRSTMENRPDKAIDYLSALEKPNQELVLELLPVLVQGATMNLAGDPVGASVNADKLRGAVARLEPRAALRLEGAALCKSVEGFGSYSLWPKGKLYRPHEPAMLYVEVKNLVSQPAVGPDGETFLTVARASLEIRDSLGKLVDQPTQNGQLVVALLSESKRYTRTPVHEFHSICYFTAPRVPGVYNVSVKVEDPIGKRSVKLERPVEIRVAGQ
jgi:hypothetical protein